MEPNSLPSSIRPTPTGLRDQGFVCCSTSLTRTSGAYRCWWFLVVSRSRAVCPRPKPASLSAARGLRRAADCRSRGCQDHPPRHAVDASGSARQAGSGPDVPAHLPGRAQPVRYSNVPLSGVRRKRRVLRERVGRAHRHAPARRRSRGPGDVVSVGSPGQTTSSLTRRRAAHSGSSGSQGLIATRSACEQSPRGVSTPPMASDPPAPPPGPAWPFGPRSP